MFFLSEKRPGGRPRAGLTAHASGVFLVVDSQGRLGGGGGGGRGGGGKGEGGLLRSNF